MRLIFLFSILTCVLHGQNAFKIQLFNESGSRVPKDRLGSYQIKLGNKLKILTMKGITNSKKNEKIIWKTKKEYYSIYDSLNDVYSVINPICNTKNGIGYSTLALLPRMKGKELIVFGMYKDQVDSIKIQIR